MLVLQTAATTVAQMVERTATTLAAMMVMPSAAPTAVMMGTMKAEWWVASKVAKWVGPMADWWAH